MLSGILRLTSDIGWIFVYLLYRATIPAYNLIDSLAYNLDCLYLKNLQRESQFCKPDQMASARGIEKSVIEKDLNSARGIEWREFGEGIMTALGIIILVVGFGIIGIMQLIQQYPQILQVLDIK
jgi:hypothetical protein